MKNFFTAIVITICSVFSLWANNLAVGIPTKVEQNTADNYVYVQFDMSWENSWRVSSAPYNYDGVWLFIKYKKASDGNWYHATLNGAAENHNTGSQASRATIQISNGKAALYYRSTDGTGAFGSSNIKLRWEYGLDGIGDDLSSEILDVKVFAIEMVYVPEAAFYVGSGGNEENHFKTYGGNNPYLISSELAINVGQTNGYLYYQTGNYSGDGAGPIPASYPKGYNTFWCMKYELTQEQYAFFLNTLTSTQKTNRYSNNFNSKRYYIKNVNGVYGCDANNNNILDQENDGQNIASNYISYADGLAYSDWACMRPMTELEYEKACRGTQTPIMGEFACGSYSIMYPQGIQNSKYPNECASNAEANCNYWDYYDVGGPMRVGCFAKSNTNRQESGASYYGIMELSGNLFERTITVGSATGRAFTGVLGDGVLDANGNANTIDWPLTNTGGNGSRGGGWSYNYKDDYMIDKCVSDRSYAKSQVYRNMVNDPRSKDSGIRCVVGVK